jgi:hypothetical protein
MRMETCGIIAAQKGRKRFETAHLKDSILSMENSQTLNNEREWGFQDYVSLAIRRKWIIISVFLIVFSSAMGYFFTRPPVYESAATFIIESSDKNTAKSSPLLMMSNTRPFGFYETLAKSRIYHERIIEATQKDSALAGCTEFTAEVLGSLIKNLRIAETEYDDLYALAAKANHPVIVYRFADIAISEFKRRCQEIELEESRKC